jgi:hypothetical protein
MLVIAARPNPYIYCKQYIQVFGDNMNDATPQVNTAGYGLSSLKYHIFGL